MFKKMISGWSKKKLAESLAQYEEFLQVGRPEELGGILAASSMARRTLIAKPPSGAEFPHDLLDGERSLDSSAITALASYNMLLIQNLQQVQEISKRTGNPSAALLASGLTVWIMSIRSLQAPELLSNGRRIWSHLVRGSEYWVDAIITMSNTNSSHADLGQYWYLPKFLAPDISPPFQVDANDPLCQGEE